MQAFRIGKLFGVELRVDWSWLFVLVLLTWNLTAVFAGWHPDWPAAEALRRRADRGAALLGLHPGARARPLASSRGREASACAASPCSSSAACRTSSTSRPRRASSSSSRWWGPSRASGSASSSWRCRSRPRHVPLQQPGPISDRAARSARDAARVARSHQPGDRALQPAPGVPAGRGARAAGHPLVGQRRPPDGHAARVRRRAGLRLGVHRPRHRDDVRRPRRVLRHRARGRALARLHRVVPAGGRGAVLPAAGHRRRPRGAHGRGDHAP